MCVFSESVCVGLAVHVVKVTGVELQGLCASGLGCKERAATDHELLVWVVGVMGPTWGEMSPGATAEPNFRPISDSTPPLMAGRIKHI